MSAPILTIKNVRKTRIQDTGFTLTIASLHVYKGERIALIGPSGCGKSTALDLLGTVLRPDAGEQFTLTPHDASIDILQHWHNESKNALAKIRFAHIGYILQTGGLLPFLSAWDNIVLGRGACAATAARKLAQKLDIGDLLPRLPGQLSVGQRQRVAIARALAGQPELVLADEPAAALDPLNADVVLRVFTDLAQDMGVSIIMVTHAPDKAAAMGFRMVPIQLRKEAEHVYATLGDAL